MGSVEQGIVHMVGPETGLTQPGKTIVCGDSHTATHGAFGAIAFGIGTSEVEHVFATQTLWQTKPKNLKIDVTGQLPKGVYAKILSCILLVNMVLILVLVTLLNLQVKRLDLCLWKLE